jgi:hypothetical protein
MARRKGLRAVPDPVDVPEGVPEHLLPVGGHGAAEQLRRSAQRDAWFDNLGLGDRLAHASERHRLTLLGLDRIGAVYEAPRLLLRGDHHPEPGEVVTHERLTADGTRRPVSSSTPPGWAHDNNEESQG